MTTYAPSKPSLWAMLKPIPRVEAVTMATLPSNLLPSLILSIKTETETTDRMVGL